MSTVAFSFQIMIRRSVLQRNYIFLSILELGAFV